MSLKSTDVGIMSPTVASRQNWSGVLIQYLVVLLLHIQGNLPVPARLALPFSFLSQFSIFIIKYSRARGLGRASEIYGLSLPISLAKFFYFF